MRDQLTLRHSIATWAAYLNAAGRNDSDIYRQFYHTFGIDILSAQTLGTTGTNMLNSKVVDNMGKME